jgi:hypothetical protein
MTFCECVRRARSLHRCIGGVWYVCRIGSGYSCCEWLSSDSVVSLVVSDLGIESGRGIL